MSRASLSLRRTTTRSPAASFVLAWPSQNSVVPSFTRAAPMSTVLWDEMTTGRKERLCGQMGVTQNASTPLSTIGPPAETL